MDLIEYLLLFPGLAFAIFGVALIAVSLESGLDWWRRYLDLLGHRHARNLQAGTVRKAYIRSGLICLILAGLLFWGFATRI